MRTIPEQNRLIDGALAGFALVGVVMGGAMLALAGDVISTWLMFAGVVAFGFLGALVGVVCMAVWTAITGDQPFE